jgi:hypothetical protein
MLENRSKQSLLIFGTRWAHNLLVRKVILKIYCGVEQW